MGRKKRIHQHDYPYFLTTETTPEVRGFRPAFRRLNTLFQRVIGALYHKRELAGELELQVEKSPDDKPQCHSADELKESPVNKMKQLASAAFVTFFRRSQNKRTTSPVLNLDRDKLRKIDAMIREKKRQMKRIRKKRDKQVERDGQETEQHEQSNVQLFNLFSRLLIAHIVAFCLCRIIQKHAFKLYHFVLLPDRYYMVGQTQKSSISKVMQCFNWNLARIVNDLLGRRGHLFARRFQSVIMGEEESSMLLLRAIYTEGRKEKIDVEPIDQTCSTYLVWVKGRPFLVKLDGECPIIAALVRENGKEWVHQQLKEPLEAGAVKKILAVAKRFRVWMSVQALERLQVDNSTREELKQEAALWQEALSRLRVEALAA